MQLKNSNDHFGLIAILFHWIMALLLIGMLALGLYMADLPKSLFKLKLYGWHKETGILILMLVCLRIGWRYININPSLASLPWYERFAAKAVHWAFYVFMFAMPITGWLITSAAGVPASFFGLFVMPDLIAPDKQLIETFATIHSFLGYALIVTIILHVAAALKHHFYDKDSILRRMWL